MMMKASSGIPEVTGFFHEPTSTVSYVVSDPTSQRCAVIDPVLDYDAPSGRVSTESAEAIAKFIDGRGFELERVLETHVHADHLAADRFFAERYGVPICIGDQVGLVQSTFKEIYNLPDQPINGSPFDKLMADGETFTVGGIEGEVVLTPGHTPSCVSYKIGDALFVGDLCFMPDFGTARCDFPGGDALMLYRSIQRVFRFPDETRFFTLHDYAPGGRPVAWESTVGEQRRNNIQVGEGSDEASFAKKRAEKDATLGMPGLILPAIQVNMRAGFLPEPEENGQAYLKIPLNRF